MKQVIIMRHGHSGSKAMGMTDFDRTLTPHGKEQAAIAADILKTHQIIPQVVIASSAERAKQTADIICDTAKFNCSRNYMNELYLAHYDKYLIELSEIADDMKVALIVGHNPGIEFLLYMLTQEHKPFPPAGMALVQFEVKTWSELKRIKKAQLIDCWAPGSEE